MKPCQACGQPSSPQDPTVHVDGYRIHTRHLTDPRSGYYGATPDTEEPK